MAPLALPVGIFTLVQCHHTPTLPLQPPPPPTRALARLVSSSQGMAGLAWHGMVWLGVRSRYFHNEVRWYLPTQYLKIQVGTFCQILAAPPSGSREGLRRKFRRGMFHIFAKKFHFGTPHLLDFQVAAWWKARLYACFRKVAPLALPVGIFTLVQCHHTVSAASPICSDFQTFCPDWLHFGHFLCFGGIAASQLSHRIFPIYF